MIKTKWLNLMVLALAELLALALWFSASAVIPQLTAAWDLSSAQQSWMTMSVQLGFVVGALFSALLNIADRISNRYLIAVSASIGALLNGAVPVFDAGPDLMLALRFGTGFMLAGVYPPGMKLVATWCKEDRGLGIGILVGAITLGSAMPHLLNAVPLFGDQGIPAWLFYPHFWSEFLSRSGRISARPLLLTGDLSVVHYLIDRPGWPISDISAICGSYTPCGHGHRFCFWPAMKRPDGRHRAPGWQVSAWWASAWSGVSWPACWQTGWEEP